MWQNISEIRSDVSSTAWLTVRLTDLLSVWLIVPETEPLTDRLPEWLNSRLTHNCLTDWLSRWLSDSLSVCLIDRQIDWLESTNKLLTWNQCSISLTFTCSQRSLNFSESLGFSTSFMVRNSKWLAFYSYLEFLMKYKVQKASDSDYYTPSSEFFGV